MNKQPLLYAVFAAILSVFTLLVVPVTMAHASTTNTLEDIFQRADQPGWGMSANADGLPNFSWAANASGSSSYDTVSGNTGQLAYDGTPNSMNFALAGGTAYSGGDLLSEFSVSATGHVNYMQVFNATSDGQNGYLARVNTASGKLELEKRAAGTTTNEASKAITLTPGQKYWIRSNLNGAVFKTRVWADGTPEPSSWGLSWTDSGAALASNPVALGNQFGSSDTATANVYAFAFSSDPGTPALVPGAGASNPTVPGAPVIGTAASGDTTATVNWSAPSSDGGSSLTDYIITPYIGGVAQSPIDEGGTATTDTVTGLTDGTSYTFAVAAVNAVGTGGNSAQSNAVTPSNLPGAPTSVSASAGNASVALTWTAPSDGGSPITGYTVTPSPACSGCTGLTPTGTSTTVNGLTNGTSYTFTVTATNANGTGSSSAPSNAVTPANGSGGNSQQLLAEAATGDTNAHLLGISPGDVSGGADDINESVTSDAPGLNHALNINNLFIDWATTCADGVPDPTVNGSSCEANLSTRLSQASAGGAVPEMTWMPCSFALTGACKAANNPFPLANIAAGDYDSYLTMMANEAVAFGQPIIIRFAHEMNGNWYPWGNANGNTPAEYIAAWQHVVTVFRNAGATNVYWLWTPNKSGHSLSNYYPGNSYVDFTGVDGYNGPQYSNTWMTPTQVFDTSFAQFPTFTDKPVIIGEVGSVESSSTFGSGQSKATWMTQFIQYLASNPHGVNPVGFVWSDFNASKSLDSSASCFAALAAAMAAQWVSS